MVPLTSITPNLPETILIQYLNEALKNYQSVLVLSRSPLANSPLVQPALVLDDVSPTADERGHALQLVLRWAVEQLAPAPSPYPIGQAIQGLRRPFDDPTWIDPHWWRYNILRHRYIEPLRPDDFVEGGRHTESLIALTGISSQDVFFYERNRAISEVAQRVQRLFAPGEETQEVQRLAVEEVYRPLQSRSQALLLLGIASIFQEVFSRRLLLQMAQQEQVASAEGMIDQLITQRYLRGGDIRGGEMGSGGIGSGDIGSWGDGESLWLSPILRNFLYQRQMRSKLRLRHLYAAHQPASQENILQKVWHLQQAEEWRAAARLVIDGSGELIRELEVEGLKQALLRFKPSHFMGGYLMGQDAGEDWRQVQLLLSDLYRNEGNEEEAILHCRRALKVAHQRHEQGVVYHRMGKLYEKRNQLLALNYYQQAIDALTEENSSKETLPKNQRNIPLAEVHKDRAWIYIYQQQWEPAKKDLLVALQQDNLPVSLQTDIYDALGSIYTDQKRYTQAIEYAQRALALREQSGDLLRVAKSLINLGILYHRTNAYDQAIATQQEALKICKKIDDQELTISVYMSIGVANHLAGSLPEAVQNYYAALEMCKKIGLLHTEATAHLNLAEALADLGQQEQAIFHWQTGYQLSQKMQFKDQLVDFLDLRQRTVILQGLEVESKIESKVVSKTIPAVTKPFQTTNQADLPSPLWGVWSSPEAAKIYTLLQQHGSITPKRLMDAASISKATATRRLTALAQQGYLQTHGSGRGVYYTLKQEGAEEPAGNPINHQINPVSLEKKLSNLQHSLAIAHSVLALRANGPSLKTTPRLDLTIRFQNLPDLKTFCAIERHISQEIDAEIHLVVE